MTENRVGDKRPPHRGGGGSRPGLAGAALNHLVEVAGIEPASADPTHTGDYMHSLPSG